MAELIVIGGPTASGKTQAAIQLAQFLNCPILSADSRQFFKEMNIGTAKPNNTELQLAEHYFINNKSINEEYSAGNFERDALALLDKLFKKHPKIILVGGSGLYIDAVCIGMDNLPKSHDLRHELNDFYHKEGLLSIQNRLRERDPEYFLNCDNQNPIRVLRALEIILLSGKTMAENFNNTPNKRTFTVRHVILDWKREKLYERINSRVDHMIREGLLHEVSQLLTFKEKNALQTVGYKELFEHLDGKIDLEKAIELIKQNTRRYAKRQITWFKKYQNALWVHPDHFLNPDFLANFK